MCGEEFSKTVDDIDPKVKLRRSALKPIYEIIESKKEERKNWFKKYRDGEVKKREVLEPFETMNSMISNMNEQIDKDIFYNISLCSDNINDDKVKKEITSFVEFIGKVYDILLESEKMDFKFVWKNMNKRLASSLRLYIAGYQKLVDTAISLNYTDALQLQNEGQKKIDLATNEIDILGKIIENQTILYNNELFKDGKLNQAPFLAMVFNHGEGTFSENINRISSLSYYYFTDFLEKNINQMDRSHLLNLSVYRYMGTSLFDDAEYLIKIRSVLNVINQAYKKDPVRFKAFYKKYLEKYFYMQKKINEFSVSYSFIIGNNPSDELLMQNSIKWYKDLSEGIYREASRILYFCLKLIKKKEFHDEDILKWLGFSDIVNEFKQQKKLKFNKLTEGVEPIIRNSEAHVDYDIDNEARVIIVRNVVAKEKRENRKEFTYEDFFDVTNKLAETIFSIICGIQLFIYNNVEDFQTEVNAMEDYNARINIISNTLLLFSMNGIIIDEEKKVVTESIELSLRGKLINEISIKEFGNKFLGICVHISNYEPEVDIISFSLNDKKGELIGRAIVPTKYIKLFQSDESDFKNYYLMLAKLTSTIDPAFSDNLTNDNDLLFMKSIFHSLLEQLQVVKSTLSNKGKKNSHIKNENRRVIYEIELLERVVDMYKEHTEDLRLTTHFEMVLHQYKSSIKKLNKNVITINDMMLQFKQFSDLFQEFHKVILGESTIDAYLKSYIKDQYSLSNKVGVNEPCPCGSGEKFKKCCRK